MAAWWVRIDLLQNYFAIRNVCLWRWQIILTGFSAESFVMSDPRPPYIIIKQLIGPSVMKSG
jgi:hypothetical protein